MSQGNITFAEDALHKLAALFKITPEELGPISVTMGDSKKETFRFNGSDYTHWVTFDSMDGYYRFVNALESANGRHGGIVFDTSGSDIAIDIDAIAHLHDQIALTRALESKLPYDGRMDIDYHSGDDDSSCSINLFSPDPGNISIPMAIGKDINTLFKREGKAPLFDFSNRMVGYSFEDGTISQFINRQILLGGLGIKREELLSEQLEAEKMRFRNAVARPATGSEPQAGI